MKKIYATCAAVSLTLMCGLAVIMAGSSPRAYAAVPPKFEQAIDSSQSTTEAKTVSGSVKKLLAVPSTGNISATADLGVGLANVTVYAQWSEGSKSKGRWSSPIYKGTTDVNGNFKIKMLPYTDVNGVKRTFDGEVGLHPGGMYNEKIQIWVINPDRDKLNQFWGYGQRPSPDGYVQDSTGKAYWGNTYGVQGADTYFVEKQDPTKTSVTPVNTTNTLSGSRGGHISGKVYWNWVQGVGSARWVDLNNPDGDKLVRGQKVQASYLSDCAVKQVETYYADNKTGLFKNHTFRASASTTPDRSRWVAQDEANLQKYIQEQIRLGTGSCQWIAETVQATTGPDGKYTLQFNGSWGNNQRSCQTVPAGRTCGEVAPDPDTGFWEGIGRNDQKHVNWDYLNVSLVDKPDGIGYMDPWRGNNFFDTRQGAAMFKPFGVTGNYAGSNEQWDDLNLGLVPVETYFDVLEYDTSTHAATPGSTVNTSTEGLAPANKIDSNKYRITWYDPSEKQVGHCELTADNSGVLESCPFKVPADLKENTVYNAVLTSVDEHGKDVVVLGTDSFLAVVPDYDANYQQTKTKVGVEATSAAPTFDKKDTAPVEKLKYLPAGYNPVFELDKAKMTEAGLNVDDFSIDPSTGAVTWKSPAGEDGTVISVPVKMTYSKPLKAGGTIKISEPASAPFIIQAPQDDDKDGVANDKDKCLDTPSGQTVQANGCTYAQQYDTSYDAVTADPGSKASSGLPKFKDNQTAGAVPSDTPPVEGIRYSLDKTNLPDGVTEDTVTVDPDTGKVTWNIPTGTPANTYQIPVKVSYPNNSGSTTVKVPFTVNKATPPPAGSITKPGDQSSKAGEAITPITVSAENIKTGTLTVSGLPDGLSFNSATNKITGTPTTASPSGDPSVVTIKAVGLDGREVTETFKYTVTPPDKPATITPIADQSGTAGQPINPIPVEIANGVEPPTFTGLPDGLGYDPNTGTITGTVNPVDGAGNPLKNPKTYPVTVKVKGQDGKVVSTSFSITINPAPKPDTDKDGVDDTKDVCPGTIKGLKVDTDGCAANQKYLPEYSSKKVAPGASVTVPAPTYKNAINGAASTEPTGTKYALDTDHLPSGVKASDITVNPNTGAITWNVPADQALGDVSIPVKVTFPDKGGTLSAHAKISVASISNGNDPKYQDATPVDQGDTQTLPTPKNPDNSALPSGTHYSKTSGPDWITVDPNTGVVTIKPLADTPAGDYNAVIHVTYPDGTFDDVTVPVHVNAKDPVPNTDSDGDGVKDENDKCADTPASATVDAQGCTAQQRLTPEYDGTKEGTRGIDTVTVPAPTFKDTVTNAAGTPPTGTTYTLGASAPTGATINSSTGAITWVIPTDSTIGNHEIPVVINYGDGSKGTASAIVKVNGQTEVVTPEYKPEVDPIYGETEVIEQGQTKTTNSPIFKDKGGNTVAKPDGTKFYKADGMPDWVSVDENTGAITMTPGLDANPQDYNIKVVVKYKDGTQDTAVAKATVTQKPRASATITPILNQVGKQGEPLTAIPIQVQHRDPNSTITVTGLPKGLTYDQAQGKIVGTPTEPTNGPQTVTVTAIGEDGAPVTSTFTFTVNPPDQNTTHDPKYSDPNPSEAGKTLVVPGPKNSDGKPLPGGTIYTKVSGPDWATVNPDTGAVSAEIPAGTAPGDY
ncbi:Rib/alpha-like domain-containing protein, partial [uncultured Mobiluncus sp.]|uniref:Rib/alpha-like domain-containing protein n=1 Tax=uncultured Mobiluncus sp. TaxID=293425 RepID=UPI002804A822